MEFLIVGVMLEGEILIFSICGINLEGGIWGVDVEIISFWCVISDQVVVYCVDIVDNGVIDDLILVIFVWFGCVNFFFEQYNGYDLIGVGLDWLVSFFDENIEGIYNLE